MEVYDSITGNASPGDTNTESMSHLFCDEFVNHPRHSGREITVSLLYRLW